MADLSIGTTDITKIAIGTTELKKISIGTNEIWSAGPPVSTPTFDFSGVNFPNFLSSNLYFQDNNNIVVSGIKSGERGYRVYKHNGSDLTQGSYFRNTIRTDAPRGLGVSNNNIVGFINRASSNNIFDWAENTNFPSNAWSVRNISLIIPAGVSSTLPSGISCYNNNIFYAIQNVSGTIYLWRMNNSRGSAQRISGIIFDSIGGQQLLFDPSTNRLVVYYNTSKAFYRNSGISSNSFSAWDSGFEIPIGNNAVEGINPQGIPYIKYHGYSNFYPLVYKRLHSTTFMPINSSSGGSFYGYDDGSATPKSAGGLGQSVGDGSISDGTFMIDGTTYTIKAIRFGSSRQWKIVFDKRLPINKSFAIRIKQGSYNDLMILQGDTPTSDWTMYRYNNLGNTNGGTAGQQHTIEISQVGT